MTTHMSITHKDEGRVKDRERRDEINAKRRAKGKERREEINARKRAETLAARLEKHKRAHQDARDAYWADKPYYTSRDEFIELCREATLTESRTEEMRARWVKHRGADVSAQTCITYMLSPLN